MKKIPLKPSMSKARMPSGKPTMPGRTGTKASGQRGISGKHPVVNQHGKR